VSNLQLDGNKLLHHLDKVNQWSRGELITPIYIAFSPTSYCNHHCVFCVYHYKEFKPIFFPLERYQSLAKEWAKAGVRSVFFAGDGDPLLNKQCHEMVKATKESGIDIALNTNGRLLNEKNIPVFVENLSFIRISVNAGSAENYAKVHGTNEKDFDIVMENISTLVKMKKEKNSLMTIGVQLVLLSQNVHEVKALAFKLKEIGVDYFSIKPFLKHPDIAFDDNIEDLNDVLDGFLEFQKEISTDKFSFALRKGLFLDKFQRHYKKCQSTDFMIEIDAVGDLYSCGPYIGNPEHKLGNIMKESFEVVWESEQAKKTRTHVSCNVDVSKCMPFCRPDSVNDVLWKLTNPPQHVNYI
jgi:radical SAM protein with 4Fe4S-binding SPASM domain